MDVGILPVNVSFTYKKGREPIKSGGQELGKIKRKDGGGLGRE